MMAHHRRPNEATYCDKGVQGSEDVDWESPAAKAPWAKVYGFTAQTLPDHEDDRQQIRAEVAGDY